MASKDATHDCRRKLGFPLLAGRAGLRGVEETRRALLLRKKVVRVDGEFGKSHKQPPPLRRFGAHLQSVVAIIGAESH